LIGHFPWLHPDETLLSGHARSISRQPFHSDKAAVEAFYGRTTITAVTDLPSRLSNMATSLPPAQRLELDYLIDDHTLWPFLAAFHPSDQRLESRNQMIGDGRPYLCLGLMAMKCPFPEKLRFCVICASRDRSKYGETFWHRSHQLPGINVCPHHNIRLQASEVSYRHNRNRHRFTPAEAAIPRQMILPEEGSDVEWQIAREAEWLLTHPFGDLSFAELREILLRRLTEFGFATYSSRVRATLVLNEFQQRYPQWLLVDLGCAIEQTGETWIERLLRHSRSCQHPLKYLLFIHFSGLKLSELSLAESFDAGTQPFGRSPWPCLNKASDHYGSSTIDRCEIAPTRGGRNLACQFACDVCGMTYVRIGPDKQISDRLRRHSIPQYGPVWEGRLSELWTDPKISIRGLCRILGVDSNTARRQALRLGFDASRPGSRLTRTPKEHGKVRVGPQRDISQAKSEWLQLCLHWPEASRTQLRKLRPDLYTALYRHARTWLKENSPLPTRSHGHVVVDWAQRDREIEGRIPDAASRLRQRIPPVRVTPTALLREAGAVWAIGKKLRLMPKTQTYLQREAESRTQFAIRRIEAVAAANTTNGAELPLWVVARKAGLRPEIKNDPSVESALKRRLSGARH
jgi:hypothetical protein